MISDQALILLGGKGQRLRPLTLHLPKPLLPVANRPFLTYLLELLRRHRVREILFSISDAHPEFPKQLRRLPLKGFRWKTILEKKPLGTAGALRHALRHIRGTLMVLNGDVLTDFPLSELRRFHRQKKADVTIATVSVEDPTQYGTVETSRQNRILRFLEKPSWEETFTPDINAGIYLLEPSVVQAIPPDVPCSLEREIFPKLLAEGNRVYAFHSDRYWLDIGTTDRYLQAHRDLLTGKIPMFSAGGKNHAAIASKTRIHPGAEISGFASIGPECTIGAKAWIQDSVLMNRVKVEDGARLKSCIIGPDCRIGHHAMLREGTVLSAKSDIKPYSVL